MEEKWLVENPYENLTLAIRSIKEDLKEILSHYPEDFYFGQIHFSILNEVFKELGWKPDFSYTKKDLETYNIFIPIDVPNKEFYYELTCSWIYPKSYLEKIYNKE